MTDPDAPTPPLDYPDEVRRKALRMLHARARRAALWSQIAHVGVLGFVFVLPVVLAAFAGRALGSYTGSRSAPVVAILTGVIVGAYASWRQIQRSLDPPRQDASRSPE